MRRRRLGREFALATGIEFLGADLVKRGRKPKEDPTKVRSVPIEFVVTEDEREELNRKAREDGFTSRGAWIRFMLELPEEPEDEDAN